jgi:hypothetical protein
MPEIRNGDEKRLKEGRKAEWQRGIEENRDKLRAWPRTPSGREQKPEGKEGDKRLMRIMGD